MGNSQSVRPIHITLSSALYPVSSVSKRPPAGRSDSCQSIQTSVHLVGLPQSGTTTVPSTSLPLHHSLHIAALQIAWTKLLIAELDNQTITKTLFKSLVSLYCSYMSNPSQLWTTFVTQFLATQRNTRLSAAIPAPSDALSTCQNSHTELRAKHNTPSVLLYKQLAELLWAFCSAAVAMCRQPINVHRNCNGHRWTFLCR